MTSLNKVDMNAPTAPGVGDSIDKWESWIERYLTYLRDVKNDTPLGVCLYTTFDAYKAKEIKNFGTNWMNAVKWGDDKKYINIMENNWRYHSYVDLTGERPRSFELKEYLR